MRGLRRRCPRATRNGILRAMSAASRHLAFLLCLAVPCLTTPAYAQVTVDLHALDQAPGAAPAPPQAAPPQAAPSEHKAPAHTSRRRITAHPTEKRAEPEHATAKPAAKTPPAAPAPSGPTTTEAPKPAAPPTPAAPAPPPAVVGVTPPPAPVIPPPAPADAPMAPTAPPPIVANSGTTIEPLPKQDGTGVRLDFAQGASDLTPISADAVKALVAAAPKDDATTFNVMAYAAGVAEDPSTARRVSLSRALAVRAALMAYGVPSTHIYVRALGSLPGDGPQDRVDVLVLGANAPAPIPGGAGTRTP
jgi:outer membrane protein OmpA-like peptidoglycan-associated protein